MEGLYKNREICDVLHVSIPLYLTQRYIGNTLIAPIFGNP